MKNLLLPGPLDLEATLYSGQAFRWKPLPGGWHQGWVQNLPLRVRREGRRLRWESASDPSAGTLRSYFRLDETHEGFIATAPTDPHLASALAAFPGLRLLRQDPWELLVSFLISQNSNEARIRGCVEALCQRAGSPVEWEGQVRHAFPSPPQLATLDEADLRSLGMGYRAPFLWAAARRVLSGRLDPWRLPRLPYEEAFRQLLEVPGVGPKVADCILLYGCDHRRAFPTDVWVKRFLSETYHRRRSDLRHDRVQAFALGKFGAEAGYAQHYLFHYRRTVGSLPEKPA